MRAYTFLTSVLIGLAAAAPAPQDIDFALAESLPDPTSTVTLDATAQVVSYTAAAIYASALEQITATDENPTTATTVNAPNNDKRAAPTCTALPAGSGPVPSPDDPATFLGLDAFKTAAEGAQIPSGYTQTFSNLKGSSNAYGYLGYTNLKSYDPATCAARCNSISGCVAINIYFERDPSLDPGSGTASSCPNPPSTTNIKCAFWGGPVTPGNAVNTGQYRNKFQVVIAGSNGYVSNGLASIPGYGTPTPLGTYAINAPLDEYGSDTFLGSAIFNSGPFNASLCAQACTEKSNYAIAHPPTDGSPVQTCQFFNTYILYINSTANPAKNQGQYCAMYSQSWPTKYATNNGQYRGNDRYMIQYSFSFSNATNPGKANPAQAVAQASKDISWHSLQPFCTAYLGYVAQTSSVSTTTTTTPLATQIVSLTTTTTITSLQKRDEPTDTPSVPAEDLSLLMGGPIPTQAPEKRDLTTPNVLAKYPDVIVSSACSLQATSPVPVTTTIISTSTADATTTTVSAVVATATSTVCVKTSTSNFKIQVVAPGAIYDGAYIAAPHISYYYMGITTHSYYAALPVNTFNLNTTSGQLRDNNPSTPNLFVDWSGYDGGQLWMWNGGRTVTWSIDMDTMMLSATGKVGSLSISTFYITENPYTQLALATASRDQHGTGFKSIPVQIKAVCA